MFIGKINGQVTKLDSLKSAVETTTDSLFLEDWAINIHAKQAFDKFEKEEIVEWFIKRSGELNYPVIQGHFKFRKSIQKTINGDYDAALKIIEEIFPVFEEHKSYMLQSACYNTKGSMLSAIGDIQGGIENLEKAIDVCGRAEASIKMKQRAMSNHYNVLGTIFNKDSQYSRALENYEKAYDLALKGTPEGSKARCFCLLNLAVARLKLNEVDKALAYAKASMKESLIGKYNDTYCMSLQRMGLVYSALDQKDSALFYFNLMEKVAYENKYNQYLYQAYKVQANHYEKHGQTTKALEKHKLYSKLIIQSEKEKKKALSNYLVSESKKRDKEKADFELKQKIQKEKQKQNKITTIFLFLLGLILVSAIIFYNKLQKRRLNQRLKDKKIQLELMQSQIRTIGSQMNPHFVFNALNSVQDLILQKDVRGSSIYLAKFADLMRQTLDNSKKNTIPLEKEIEILQLYLELESLRFNDDFSFTMETHDLNLSKYEIPAMLLQPYVENAIKHGLLHKEGSKVLKIVFHENNGSLQCIIEDNGVGRERSAQINTRRDLGYTSFATKANEERLDLINKTSSKKTTLEIIDLMENNVACGTKVVFTFS